MAARSRITPSRLAQYALELGLMMLSLVTIALVVIGPNRVLEWLQPAPIMTVPVVPNPGFSRTLRFAWSGEKMRGDDVRFVQSRLMRDTLSDSRPDGLFDRHTELAVLVFQHRHGLPTTGMVDQATWQALER